VLTHTKPWPPPGAGGLAAASVVLFFAAAPVAAAGLAAAELFGLNKSPRENFAGDGDAFAAVSAFLRLPFALGAAAGEVAADGDVAGLAAAPASAFLRPRLAGDEAGAAAGEDDAAASLGDAAVWAFLCVRFFGAPAGDSPGAGDCACTAQALASPIAKMKVRNLLVMETSVNKPRDHSQRISNEQPNPLSAQKNSKRLQTLHRQYQALAMARPSQEFEGVCRGARS
jgi:hypothetical protein